MPVIHVKIRKNKAPRRRALNYTARIFNFRPISKPSPFLHKIVSRYAASPCLHKILLTKFSSAKM